MSCPLSASPRNKSLRDLVFLKLPIWVVPTPCDDFVKRRLGNSLYVNIGAVIRVDTHDIWTSDTVLSDWHWVKDIHLLLMMFIFLQSHLLLLGLALLCATDGHLLRV